jgi:hypothetical protein
MKGDGAMFTLGSNSNFASHSDQELPLTKLCRENIEIQNKMMAINGNSRAKKVIQSVAPEPIEDMHAVEEKNGVVRPDVMGGEGGITASMVQSLNLGNTSHYDKGDQSQCFSIWTCRKIGASNWAFLGPNTTVLVDGHLYHGIAIKLYHGRALGWDGHIIRHCTARPHNCEDNLLVGSFWGTRININAFWRKKRGPSPNHGHDEYPKRSRTIV